MGKHSVARHGAIAVMPTVAPMVLATPVIAKAQETTTYTYDALGRVVTVVHSGGPATGITTAYIYDPVGNRTNVNVSGAPTGSGSGSGTSSSGSGSGASSSGNTASSTTKIYIVVPINGYVLIAINQ